MIDKFYSMYNSYLLFINGKSYVVCKIYCVVESYLIFSTFFLNSFTKASYVHAFSNFEDVLGIA